MRSDPGHGPQRADCSLEQQERKDRRRSRVQHNENTRPGSTDDECSSWTHSVDQAPDGYGDHRLYRALDSEEHADEADTDPEVDSAQRQQETHHRVECETEAASQISQPVPPGNRRIRPCLVAHHSGVSGRRYCSTTTLPGPAAHVLATIRSATLIGIQNTTRDSTAHSNSGEKNHQ